MTKMRAMQVTRPGGPFELVERKIADSGPGHVRIIRLQCSVIGDKGIKDGTQY